jgi:XRE family aerobic/anaerobic benzoate catabolism transcriptional regulator
VIATGGSIVESPESFERLRETCRTVWLKASSHDHLERVRAQGDRRPMRNHPRAMEELEDLLKRRTPAYSRCDLTVETSGKSPDEVVRAILEFVGE